MRLCIPRQSHCERVYYLSVVSLSYVVYIAKTVSVTVRRTRIRQNESANLDTVLIQLPKQNFILSSEFFFFGDSHFSKSGKSRRFYLCESLTRLGLGSSPTMLAPPCTMADHRVYVGTTSPIGSNINKNLLAALSCILSCA